MLAPIKIRIKCGLASYPNYAISIIQKNFQSATFRCPIADMAVNEKGENIVCRGEKQNWNFVIYTLIC
jgi:hypothetical protein